jgi:hypothetical protein
MSLAEAAKQGPPRQAKKTFPESAEGVLSPEDYAALLELLSNPSWPAQQIADLLRKECNYTVSASTVRTARRERV